MKHFYITVLATIFSCGTFAAMAEAPEAIYAIGSFTNFDEPGYWIEPTQENAELLEPYKMVQSESAPGTYHGEFRVYSTWLTLRFYDNLEGWNGGGSLACSEIGNLTEFEFVNGVCTTPMYYGTGTWSFLNLYDHKITVDIDYNTMTVTFSIPDYDVYFIGSPADWLAPSMANYEIMNNWKLNRDPNQPGVYNGVFDIPEGNPEFRFTRGLLGWNSESSYGASIPDFDQTPCLFENHYINTPMVNGMGNWLIENWGGGQIRFTLDFNEMTFQAFDFKGAAVELVKAEDIAPIYYDLNGVSVENPTKGIYITSGKKVIF